MPSILSLQEAIPLFTSRVQELFSSSLNPYSTLGLVWRFDKDLPTHDNAFNLPLNDESEEQFGLPLPSPGHVFNPSTVHVKAGEHIQNLDGRKKGLGVVGDRFGGPAVGLDYTADLEEGTYLEG